MKSRIKFAFALLTVLAISGLSQAFAYDGRKYGNRYGRDNNSIQAYAPDGTYLGNLNDNRYDPNSVSNPYGKYGSRYSRKSINNPYGPYGKTRW